MFKEYEAGRTPNPDVLCNKFVKFGVWLDKAKEMGFDYLATGHYARIKKSKEYGVRSSGHRKKLLTTCLAGRQTHYSLLTSRDDNKDQTYFLHQLTQKQLKHVIFPIGDYLKSEVRSLARKFGLPTAEKEEVWDLFYRRSADEGILMKKINRIRATSFYPLFPKG